MNLPHLAITLGDVNGIGPELVAKFFSAGDPQAWCRPVVFGCEKALLSVRDSVPNYPNFVRVESLEAALTLDEGIPVYDAGHPAPEVEFGIENPAAGKSAVVWIEAATRACMRGDLDGMVTCPISKSCIYKAGYHYIGHTELVAELTNTPSYRMCLFTESMRIVHITGHMSLANALTMVKKDRIVESAQIGHDALLKLGIPEPRIAIAGLNPHAGEDGAFGREEIDEIMPAVTACRECGILCDGPFPPDTVFRKMRAGEYDMVIAMYHDQGHIPLKLLAMDEGVNVTLGTPIVRTSVDHGTAFDIAGKGVACERSLVEATKLAARMGTKL
jgi:4-phospho-D-threonate 3-dehydrogenase / 4-phospho-D-erythronate 3-dehydrogenase